VINTFAFFATLMAPNLTKYHPDRLVPKWGIPTRPCPQFDSIIGFSFCFFTVTHPYNYSRCKSQSYPLSQFVQLESLANALYCCLRLWAVPVEIQGTSGACQSYYSYYVVTSSGESVEKPSLRILMPPKFAPKAANIY
jgi:hypothetical protein